MSIDISAQDIERAWNSVLLQTDGLDFKGEEIRLYALVDYGIKDPKFYNLIAARIKTIENIITMNQTSGKKSMKGKSIYKGRHVNKLKL